ncbi:MAG: ATP-binding protein [Mycobacterium sp.]|uniref:ATP-binding protein n=1 Tax=Mycobacterium sp. TaxID=1785 RepID=UPI003CC6A40B
MTAIDQPGTPTSLQRVGLADPLAAAGLRRDLGQWLHEAVSPPVSATRYSDILCGVNEALANCAEHAYSTHPAPGPIRMDATYNPCRHSVRVRVADRGTWKQRTADSGATRGRGLALMHALADRCTVERRAEGTTICLDYDTLTE